MVKIFKIGTKSVGPNSPVYIIAEAGVNHNGDVDYAKNMIKCAKKCGVDAVKFQVFKADEFISNPEDVYTYLSQGKLVTESMLEMFKRYEFNKEEWREIFNCCQREKIDFFATPQNRVDLDFLIDLVDIPVIKVGSDDLTNLELLKYYASKGKPLIISAGMAFLSEIEDAVNTIQETGNTNLAVLHCVSSYPTNAEDVHLRKMNTISQVFKVVTGFSDHTHGSTAAIGAVALGASIIEKHFTLDNNLPGPDHLFSANPDELKDLVNKIRYIEKALGQSSIAPTLKECEMRKLARRSIIASIDIEEGEIIRKEHIDFKRPGNGLPPKFVNYILGRNARIKIQKNDQITFDNIC